MRTLYLDCGMGAAGDMLAAALLELIDDKDAFLAELNALAIPGVNVSRSAASKCGINGTYFTVTVNGTEEESLDEHGSGHDHAHDAPPHEHEHDLAHDGPPLGHVHDGGPGQGHDHPHHHSGMRDIEHLITEHMALPEAVQKDVLAVYRLIAEAESRAHGVPVPEIHFHEVGTMDAVADITAVCLLMHRLAPAQVIVSPVRVGYGHVRCAHGILPVPAPATAYILRDVPIYGGSVEGELCTPTGAALLKHFATRFGAMPQMKVSAIGYGMGKKDFEFANCVRAFLGETEEEDETVLELSCNIDDMTPEAVGFAAERLLKAGALDVYTTAIGMKKSRPGILLSVLCREEEKDAMLSLIFRLTTTLGVRENMYRRYTLRRSVTTLTTPYGPVRRKQADGYGTSRMKYEYEDIARVAREQDISLSEAIQRIEN